MKLSTNANRTARPSRRKPAKRCVPCEALEDRRLLSADVLTCTDAGTQPEETVVDAEVQIMQSDDVVNSQMSPATIDTVFAGPPMQWPLADDDPLPAAGGMEGKVTSDAPLQVPPPLSPQVFETELPPQALGDSLLGPEGEVDRNGAAANGDGDGVLDESFVVHDPDDPASREIPIRFSPEVEREFQELRRASQERQRGIEFVKEQIVQKEQELQEAEQSLVDARETFDTAQQQFEQAKTDREEAQERFNTLNGDLSEARERLAQAESDREIAIDRKLDLLASLHRAGQAGQDTLPIQSALFEVERDLQTAENAATVARAEIERLTEEVSEAQRDLRDAQMEFLQARENRNAARQELREAESAVALIGQRLKECRQILESMTRAD